MSLASFVSGAMAEYLDGRHEVSLALGCCAIDATAQKLSPDERAVGKRTKTFLDENMGVVTLCGFPGIFAGGMRIRCVDVDGIEPEQDGRVSMSTIIYTTVRCALVHNCSIDDTITFTDDTYIGDFVGTFILPKSLPLGLIMAAVLHPLNAKEYTPTKWILTLGTQEFTLDSLWWKNSEFLQAADTFIRGGTEHRLSVSRG